MLKLKLKKMPSHVQGIYGPNKDRMPERALFLHPEAADSFFGFCEYAVVSDMFRSPESSLAAVRAGRGAKAPGFSGHNYGLAIDLDVKATMRMLVERGNLPGASKLTLDRFMEDHGWFCHRRDHLLDHESWHYNFLGIGAVISPKVRTTSGYIEARILELYGDQLKPDDVTCQGLLANLGIYNGKLDGEIGPISKAAINVFRRGWGLGEGTLDTRTRRTLAYVACEKQIS
jgi:hypothetical protein